MAAAPSPTRLLVRLAALAAVAAAGAFTLSAAPGPDAPPAKAPDKPARPPEEEDPDAKPVSHHVTSDEPDAAGPKGPGGRAVDLKAAARNAKHLAVRKLFKAAAVPHDVVHFNGFIQKYKNQSVAIAPIPDYVGEKPDVIVEPFTVTPLAEGTFAPGEPIQVPAKAVSRITPYEKLAENAVDELSAGNYDHKTEPGEFLSRYDRDVAEAQVLTSVLLRLQSARQTGGRRGPDWQTLEDSLKTKLLGVLLDELDDRVQAGQWDDAFALTKELAGSYRTPDEQKRIVQPLADLVRQTLTPSADEAQKAEARRRLLQLEDLFPGSDVVQPVREELRRQAEALLEQAKQERNKARKEQLLKEAGEAFPGLAGLRTYQIQESNEHATLRVGVRRLPSRMSPGLASTDSDLRAVELVFESLVKLEPDGVGGARWAPGMATGRPTVIASGRQFELPPDLRWADGNVTVTVNDVADTLKQMREGRLSRRPPVWGALLNDLNNAEAANNVHRVPLTLKQGWLDPLALMNFKVLPSGVDATSPDFAADPRGSGPYIYAKEIKNDEGGRLCVAFTANSNYGSRPGRNGLPRIESIHFIAYPFADDADPKAVHLWNLAALLADAPDRLDRLDLLLDLTAPEAAALREKAADLHLKTVTGRATPNRRIYFLAVNNDRLHLGNPAFRCALARAIDREQLLNDDFRASPWQDLHAALNGPYPVRSWAADPDPGLIAKRDGHATLDPFNVERAKAKLHESGEQDATLPLIYPAGDPQAAKAMADLAAQVKANLGVTIEPKAVSPEELHDAVERDHNYALAYYSYDFPDDVYWLGPLLTYVGDKKENILQYDGPLGQNVKDLSRRRDFADVSTWAHTLHKEFLSKEMPFIPLWQLDPLAAVHAEVDTGASDPPFDPELVFSDVDQWTVKRK